MMGKKRVYRDPAYGSDPRRAEQYWAARVAKLGASYMQPTKEELAEWDARIDAPDAGRIRPADKNAPDVLVWDEKTVSIAAATHNEELAAIVAGRDPLHAGSLECLPDEFLDLHFRDRKQ